MSAYLHVAFWIESKPTGKGRPRFDSRRARPAFTPDETSEAERAVQAAWQAAGAHRIPEHRPIDAMIELYLERPATHLRKDGSLSAEGERTPAPFRTKPDVDNAAKLILDALEGCAYPRDVAITNLSVCKRWATRARIFVHLTAPEAAC